MNDAVDIVESSRPLTGCRVIAFLSGTELFGHEKGNIETYKALRESGAIVRVGVSSIKNGGAVRELLESLEFETFTVPFGYHWSKAFFRKHPFLIFTCLWRVLMSSGVLLREIRSFRPTHLQIGHAIVYSYLAPALAWSRLPLIYRAGDEPPYDSGPNLLLWKAFARRSTTIVANSAFIRRSLTSFLPTIGTKTCVIYNRAPELPAAEQPAPWCRGTRHVVYVGQLSEHKGILHFLNAARELAPTYPDVTFDIVGGSEYSTDFELELQQRVVEWKLEERIRFHGRVPRPQPYLEAASLHVAPSLFEEPFANVVLEAKLAGIPSVVFPSGGLPEMIRHQIDGFVCKDKTVPSLIEGISFFLSDEATRSRGGKEAYQDLNGRFGRSRFRSEWVQVYASNK